MRKAVFLDRDGTINKEINYLYRIKDFEFIEGTEKAIEILKKLDFTVVVVTNQSGIARGLYTEQDVNILHEHINKLLSQHDVQIDAFYFCPHHVDGVVKKYTKQCDCRKPEIGMILKAQSELRLNLDESVIIGDKEIDILTGKRANLKNSFLVKSGHKISEEGSMADKIFSNLLECAMYLRDRS